MFVHSSTFCFGRHFGRLPSEVLLNDSLLLLSILLRWPIQLHRFILTNKVYLNLQTPALILYYIALGFKLL